MKKYSISVSLVGSMTTIPIEARNDFHARVLAVQKCSQCYKSDKRFAKGKIVVKDPKGKEVYTIPEESMEDLKKGA